MICHPRRLAALFGKASFSANRAASRSETFCKKSGKPEVNVRKYSGESQVNGPGTYSTS
jgi:hypothetical protein